MVDYATWYNISDVLVGVSRFAKLATTESNRSLGNREFIPPFILGFDDEKDIPRFYY